MDPTRIAELLLPFLPPPSVIAKNPSAGHSAEPETFALSASQLQCISTYIDILIRWNSRVNLTGIRDPEEIVTRHFGESFFVARHLFPRHAGLGTVLPGHPAESIPASAGPAQASETVEAVRTGTAAPPKTEPSESAAEDAAQRVPAQSPSASVPVTLADIGSGAGFPGIPIKLWAPDLSLTLVESNHKKATFLHEITRALTLMNVDIKNTRAESLPQGSFQVVTLRAVERFQHILPIAADLVAAAGRLTLLIGASQQDLAKASIPGFTWLQAFSIPSSAQRILLIGHRG